MGKFLPRVSLILEWKASSYLKKISGISEQAWEGGVSKESFPSIIPRKYHAYQ